MPELDIKDKNNKPAGKINLPDDIFAVSAKEKTVHSVVLNYLANQRQGTHATKTRGQVRGGGRKPWRQKHTGRSRAGSTRSPLWKGGGATFGPQPKDHSYALPKKAKRLALKSVLSGKLADGEITVIEDFTLEKPKTKEIVSVLRNLGLEGKTTLIVLPEKDNAVILSAKNIPGVTVRRVSDLNPYEVAVHNAVLMTKEAAEKLPEVGKK